MKSYMYGTLQCNQFSNTHTTNSGQTALCHHWKLAGYIANLPPNREATPTLEWQPRAKKGGQETKEGNFRDGSGGDNTEIVAVGNPALRQQSILEFITFCRRWIAVSSHLKDWRAGLDSLSLSLSLFIAVRNTSQIQICLGRASQMERFAEIFASTYCTRTSWRVTGPMQHSEKPNLLTHLTEPLQCLAELRRASVRLQMRKCEDDVGLTAEVWTCLVPATFWEHLLFVYQGMFHHSTAPHHCVALYLTCCPNSTTAADTRY